MLCPTRSESAPRASSPTCFPRHASSTSVTTQKEFTRHARPVLRRRQAASAAATSAICCSGHAATTASEALPRSADRRRLGGRGQRAGEARQQDHHRRLQPGRLRHPRRALSGQGEDRDPLPQGRLAARRTSRCRQPTATRSRRASRSCATSTSPRSASRRTARSSSRSSARSTSSCAWRRSRPPGGVEDIVMRILAAGEPIPLDKLGCPDAQPRASCKDAVAKPYGLFFVCGPTGSGKTTTLHSVLGHLNTPDTKIWTAEDPVEITQKGLRQVQMNPKAGLDFRGGDAGVPARRSRHHHGRRDARQGDRRDRHRGLADRPPGVRDAAHQLARRNRSSACSTWAWTRSTSPTRCSASWRSASRKRLCELQAGLHAATQAEIELAPATSTARSS